MAPYEAGDIAGFPSTYAQDLVDRRIAAFHPPVKADAAPVDMLSTMDRAQLIAFAEAKLGVAEEPGADVSDEDIRGLLREHVDAADLQVQAEETPKPPKKP
ncbi:hypothetical protein [Beijerinckia sp. L45]|uniref:hypothetical protein n=1 Tax=Beijerinckia sp. L45 TaxID=1641855 RepID=UPI00131B2433|nr:hypothetical protein [Beijerinckia sp. L45]